MYQQKRQFKKRRVDGKSRDNINDSICVMLELDNSDKVTFITADLSNLPPISIGDYDVLNFVQDVGKLKAMQYGECTKYSAEDE